MGVRSAPSPLSHLLNTYPPWLTRCVVTLVIAVIIQRILLPRWRRRAAAVGGRAADPEVVDDGAVLDAGWDERARRRAAAAAAAVGAPNNTEMGSTATSSRSIAGSDEAKTKANAGPPETTISDTSNKQMDVIDVTATEQWHQVLSTSTKTGERRLLVAKFTASWCTPCKKIEPFYQLLASKYSDNATFVRLDVDQLDDVSEEYEVDIMPTFLVLSKGVEVGRVGGASEMKLEKLVTEHCTKHAEEIDSDGEASLAADKVESEVRPAKLAEEATADEGDLGNETEEDNDAAAAASSSYDTPNDPSSPRAIPGRAKQRPARQQQPRATPGQEQNETPSVQEPPGRPPLKSSADHPGLSEFQVYCGAISDLYRQYIIGTKGGEVPAPIIPKSERGNVKVHLEVLNSTTSPIDVFWIDYMGREEWKGSAPPGQYWTQITWIGHPWTFRAQGGQVLLHFVPYRVIPTCDKAVTVKRNGDAIQRFTILSPSYSSSQHDLACDVMDPIFPYPITKHKSVDRALEWCYRQMERDGTCPRTVLKYLYNIVRNPAEAKYRQIRTSNKRFWQEVWCNSGRGVLHALGFQENGPYVEMGPAVGSLSPDRVKQVVGAINDLERLLAQMEGTGTTSSQQPEGADGYGRAGFGRIGMN